MKTKIDKSTPRPWKISGIIGDGYIMAGPGKPVCIVTGWSGITNDELIANRELICSAVNTIDEITAQRDELLEACRTASDYIHHWPASEPKNRALSKIAEAIARVEGGVK